MSVASDPSLDPYAYLEDANDPATVRWTAEQNARTRATLDSVLCRAALVERFEALLQIDTLEVPVERGERTFYAARRAGNEQAALYVRDGVERVLVDPAALDPSGLTALDWWYASPQGRYVAFGLSSNGDERSTLHVLDAADGKGLAEAIPDTRHCSLVWLPDESGFFYTRYPPGEAYDMRLYRHALGTPWPQDRRVFGDGRRSEDMLAVGLSENGLHLVVTVHEGWSRSDVYVADANDPALHFETLVEGRDALFDVLAANDVLFVRCDEEAARFCVFEVGYDDVRRTAWREIVAESSGTLDAFALASGALVLHYLENARSAIRVWRRGGTVETIELPGGSGVTGLSASEASGTAYLCYESFVEAPTVLRCAVDAEPARVAQWGRVRAPFDAAAYRITQEWYASNDGTRIPLTVVARADLAPNGTAPAVLYGYGGFNISLLPSFAPTLQPWLDAGGVYAIANLRGGGEFGEAWHRAGMRERKQNVFDDCTRAIEYLSVTGIADPARIAIMGGSNGGLLVAAVATQRPELLRAVVCLVPLTDMLRFHKFLIARLWIAEYGDPDDAADAAFLRAYSPYHNVRDGVAYPTMLIATAESDSRVDPMHARKFGARVQAATRGEGAILVYVEPAAGHGVGKPRYKIVAELADRWSFLFSELDASVP